MVSGKEQPRTNNPNGRPKGTPNKATKAAREAIAMFVDDNAHRLAAWLDAIAADDPKAAFDRYMSVVEYHVPKLARTELVGDGGGPVVVRMDPTDLEL